MIFSVRTVGSQYRDKAEVESLKGLGIVFEVKVDIRGAVIWFRKSYGQVELNSLEELVAFTDKYGRIIMEGEGITIYDDYIE